MKKKRLFKLIAVFITAMLCVFMLTACVDADPVVQQSKMTNLYYVSYDVTASGRYPSCESATHYVTRTEDNVVLDTVYVIYFFTEDDAMEYERVTFTNYSLPLLEQDNPDIADTIAYQRIGRIFLYGTTQGLKDALS